MDDIRLCEILRAAETRTMQFRAARRIIREAGHIYLRACTNPPTASRPPIRCPSRLAAIIPILISDCVMSSPRLPARQSSISWGHSYEFVSEADWKQSADKLTKFNADPDDLPTFSPVAEH